MTARSRDRHESRLRRLLAIGLRVDSTDCTRLRRRSSCVSPGMISARPPRNASSDSSNRARQHDHEWELAPTVQRMPLRNLRDDDGRDWEIWDVIPAAGQNAAVDPARHQEEANGKPAPFVPPEMRDGWLAFQSSSEWRRLTPIPANWSDRSDAELLVLIAQAELVLRIDS